jgi:hypothetical protein
MISDAHGSHGKLSHLVPGHDETVSDYASPEGKGARDLETNESIGLATSASGVPSPYAHTLPKDFEFFQEVISGLSGLQDDHVREMTSRLLFSFQRVLTINRRAAESPAYLPPLRFRPLDEDGVLIEWIFKDFRIGFSIEPQNGESTWYLVSNQNLEEVSKSGPLDPEAMERVLSELFSFVVSNT